VEPSGEQGGGDALGPGSPVKRGAGQRKESNNSTSPSGEVSRWGKGVSEKAFLWNSELFIEKDGTEGTGPNALKRPGKGNEKCLKATGLDDRGTLNATF